MTAPDTARVAVGTAAVGWPGTLAELGSPSPTTRLLVRVLGLRYLAQGAVGLRDPGRRVRSASAVVEGLHAASLAWAWRRFPSQRPLLLVGGAVAVALTAGDIRELTADEHRDEHRKERA
jgi:hypothetical protein